MPFPFPSSPMRLLREFWGSPTELAQELYSMFTAKGPIQIEDQVEIAAPEGRAALRVVERGRPPLELNLGGVSRAGPGAAAPAPGRRRPAPEPEPTRPRGGPGEAEAARPAAAFGPESPSSAFAFNPARPYQAPAFEVEGRAAFRGAPVQFERAPLVWDERRSQYSPLVAPTAEAAEFDAAAIQAHPVYVGVVLSGTGDTYRVTLYPQGTRADPGATVTVTVPQIDPGESIPAGTVLGAVHSYADGSYESQPLVWMYG